MPAETKTESAAPTAAPRLGPDDRLGPEQRSAAIARMGSEEFDVVVIGGGATGTGCALDAASQAQYGAPCGYIGQGGTIPLMNLLQEGFPKAQMMVCGVLGPKSNAHGPNEFLHVPYARKLTAAVSRVIAASASPRV